MRCTQCGDAEAIGMRNTAIAQNDGTHTNSTERFCRPCWETMRAADAQEKALAQQRVRDSFADGSAFAQMRCELEPLLRRADPAELASAAEYLDFVATAQPVPLPDDLQQVANQYRSARQAD